MLNCIMKSFKHVKGTINLKQKEARPLITLKALLQYPLFLFKKRKLINITIHSLNRTKDIICKNLL
jgi:hypothetical protein